MITSGFYTLEFAGGIILMLYAAFPLSSLIHPDNLVYALPLDAPV